MAGDSNRVGYCFTKIFIKEVTALNKITKRFISLVLAMVMVFALLPIENVSAAEMKEISVEEFGTPISTTTYYDQDLDCTVTEKMFFLPDSNARTSSGAGTFRNEKTFEWSSGTISTYYAQGYFTWGNGNVSVTNPTGGIINVPSQCSVSNPQITHGTGRYGLIFNKYAYVTFSCTVTSVLSMSTDLSVTVRISESGNAI